MDIIIKNAYENNLKNINVSIPKNTLIAFTGVSGSGKSTLALDTIQRECQRLYMESLGMTLNIGNKAKVDSITGLSPAISITQHQSNNNPRSSLGSITELSPYLRVLFSKIGKHRNNTNIIKTFSANHFSYNNPLGACPTCNGIGNVHSVNIDMLIDKKKSIIDFAIYGWDQAYIDRYGTSLKAAAKHYGFFIAIEDPVEMYNEIQLDLLLYGVLSEQFQKYYPNSSAPKTVPEGRFEGVVTSLLRRYSQQNISPLQKSRLEKFFIQETCPTCNGQKWNKEVLEVYVNEKNMQDVLEMSLLEVLDWIHQLKSLLDSNTLEMVGQLINTITQKLDGLINVGVEYLCLKQKAATLSAGEWQRTKLASVINSGLTGVVYVLDEPSAGLHYIDIPKIITVLQRLRDLGNTVIVIEHHMEIIKAVDHIIDFGPKAGKEGGQVIGQGDQEVIKNTGNSLTGKYLCHSINEINDTKITTSQHVIIKNASTNNLKNIDVTIPLQTFVSVTGVSGSGKTSLLFGTLAKNAEKYFKNKKSYQDNTITGLESLENVVIIDNHSIGRSSRSNIATYTDIFNDIRDIYANLTSLYSAKDFSTNTVGGRCEECQGNGFVLVPMHFLPDVQITCPVCNGKRYKEDILKVLYNGYSIADILEMDIKQALDVFCKHQKLMNKLSILQEIGLGYLLLGQTTSSLSGGECQRVKLAKELMNQQIGNRLYLFDEPTTGLHLHDVLKVIKILRKLVEQGNSVIVIEHNLSVIAQSDYLIDMGLGGGNAGGQIICVGTPKEVENCKDSHTGRILKKVSAL